MCLEDRFLQVLYKEAHFVPLSQIANTLSITDNALLSIVHRVSAAHPQFVLEQERGGTTDLIAPNPEAAEEVKAFFATGGFTLINEEEFQKYYKGELDRYYYMERMKTALSEKAWIKWVTALSLGAGIGLIAYISVRKKRGSTHHFTYKNIHGLKRRGKALLRRTRPR